MQVECPNKNALVKFFAAKTNEDGQFSSVIISFCRVYDDKEIIIASFAFWLQ